MSDKTKLALIFAVLFGLVVLNWPYVLHVAQSTFALLHS